MTVASASAMFAVGGGEKKEKKGSGGMDHAAASPYHITLSSAKPRVTVEFVGG